MGAVVEFVIGFLAVIGVLAGLIFGAEARNKAPGYGGSLHKDDDDG